MNIVLIVMDTLRYDYIGANGNDWIRTPNMDCRASNAWNFDQCMIGSFPTIPHRTDVITGRYGGPFHVWKPLPHYMPTLPRALADAGYRTQLIHDTPHLVNGGHNFDLPFHAWTFIRGAEVDRPWVDSLPLPPDGWPRDPVFDFMGEVEWDGEPCYPLYMSKLIRKPIIRAGRKNSECGDHRGDRSNSRAHLRLRRANPLTVVPLGY